MDSFIYFTLWVSLQYYFILLLKCSSFGHWEAFRWSCVPLTYPHHCVVVLNTFLHFGTTSSSMLISHICYPCPTISHLS